MIRVDRFFDIETENWDRFVMGGVVDAVDRVYASYDDEEDLFADLLQTGGEVWSWNGGLFDMLWFAELARRGGYRFVAAMAGPRVTKLECEGLILRDAIALVPMALAKASKIVGRDLSKDTGLPCRCGTACGGYCSIRRNLPPRERARLAEYLRLDVETGLDVLTAIVAEAERCGYRLTGTVGGSAYATAAEVCRLEPAEWQSGREYGFARGGYYGGRTEVFRPIAAAGSAYDINSAYPAALVRVDLPTGDRIRVSGDKATRAYRRGREGIFMARVQVPTDMHIPPLPARLPSGRVVFPVGEVAGVWTALELRHAESLGCDVSLRSGLVWGDAEPVLKPFMEHGWACRERARVEGNEALAAWQKWIINSATGKLAESPDKERLICNPRDDEPIVCDCPPPCDRRCRAWIPVDLDGHMWTAPFWRISSCGHVHWAAYLTAATRIEVGVMLRADGDGGRSAIYCDTDSCYAVTPRDRNVGAGLGQWKHEGDLTDWKAIAPKAYRYTSAATGKRVNRAKGLQGMDDDTWDRFAAGETIVRDRGVMGLRSAARRAESLFTRKRITRSNLSGGVLFGGRRLGADGLTYPLTVAELRKLER